MNDGVVRPVIIERLGFLNLGTMGDAVVVVELETGADNGIRNAGTDSLLDRGGGSDLAFGCTNFEGAVLSWFDGFGSGELGLSDHH